MYNVARIPVCIFRDILLMIGILLLHNLYNDHDLALTLLGLCSEQLAKSISGYLIHKYGDVIGIHLIGQGSRVPPPCVPQTN